ncbi:hypothetical protein Z947_2979 [Sulfitobacter geojensis]|nr:hypothetical protein Z947_2979 [Sulfitobacter geojensis]
MFLGRAIAGCWGGSRWSMVSGAFVADCMMDGCQRQMGCHSLAAGHAD